MGKGILLWILFWVGSTPSYACSNQGITLSGDHPMTEGMELHFDKIIDFSLVYDSTLQLMFVTGNFQIGIARALEKKLSENPQTSGLVLNSEGGNIYQARGMANTIKNRSLDTYVQNKCYSACTIPYVAGVERYLVVNSEIGFHTYKLDSSVIGPLINIDAEQQKDLRFFEKQIPDKEFVQQIFKLGPSDIWRPTTKELLKAGVVHLVVSENLQELLECD